MAAYQYMYTSWREFGYQVYAKSPQILETEYPLIFKHIKYTAPTGLPDTSDLEEIDRYYPLAFSSFSVNGKTCISRTRYLGQDDSGRYGNYFCHMLMFPQEPEFYATDLYASPLWKESLTAEEKQADRGPQVLDPLYDIPSTVVLGRTALSQFIDEVGEEAAIRMISALLYAKVMKQRMVIWDVPERLPKWFALLVNAFPRNAGISFSTYTMDFLQSSLDVIGVPPQGCSFNYSMEQTNRRMVVMDMNGGICTREIPVSKYAEFIVTSLQYAPDNLDLFFRFLGQLGSPIAWGQHDALCRLYLYINGGLSLSDNGLTELLQEAEALGKPVLNAQLSAHVLNALDEEYDPQPDEPVLRFLLQSEQERQAQVFGYVQEHLLRCLHGEAAALPVQLEQKWMSNPWPCQTQLIRYLADDYCLDQVVDALAEAQASSACRINTMVYCMIVAYLSGQTSSQHHAAIVVPKLLSGITSAPEDTALRIRSLERDPLLYAEALTLICEHSPAASSQWLIQLMEEASNKDPNWRLQVERALSRSPGTALLALQLLYVSCPQVKDRRTRFWALYQQHAASVAAPKLLEDYLKRVNEEHAFAEALDVLGHLSPSQMPQSILQMTTRMLASGTLEAILKKHSATVQEYLRVLKHVGLAIPDGPLKAFDGLIALQNAFAARHKPSDVLSGLSFSPGALSKQDYDAFLEAVLPRLTPLMRDDADLIAMMQYLAHLRYPLRLAEGYADQLRLLSRNLAAYSQPLACPLITAALRPASPEMMTLEKELISCYSKLSEENFRQLIAVAANSSGAPVSSSTLVKRIQQKRENSLGNKLKSFFAKK